ncbi:hypothetical protein [Methyloligella solikamskensis]|uniref:Uncharacterized protein n=1 Tax=Methyloligella solikamskensis TaxID=1177756 RepID=A0ABW3J7Y5_9HYPH
MAFHMERHEGRADPSVLLTWRFRHSLGRRKPMMPGPRSEPAREPAFRHWRWNRQAASKAKVPIKQVIAHPSRLG